MTKFQTKTSTKTCFVCSIKWTYTTFSSDETLLTEPSDTIHYNLKHTCVFESFQCNITVVFVRDVPPCGRFSVDPRVRKNRRSSNSTRIMVHDRKTITGLRERLYLLWTELKGPTPSYPIVQSFSISATVLSSEQKHLCRSD